MYCCCGGAAGVKVESEEADREVEDFAGDLVPVNEGAPVSVDGDKTYWRGRAGDVTPV